MNWWEGLLLAIGAWFGLNAIFFGFVAIVVAYRDRCGIEAPEVDLDRLERLDWYGGLTPEEKAYVNGETDEIPATLWTGAS